MPGRCPRWLTLASLPLRATQSHGNAALHYAAFWGYVDCLAALLKAGADRGLRNARGETAADWAKRAGCEGAVAVLQREPAGASAWEGAAASEDVKGVAEAVPVPALL